MNNQTNPYETKPVAEVLSALQTNLATGLADAEIRERQLKHGLNEVPEEKQHMVLLCLKHFWGLTAIIWNLLSSYHFFFANTPMFT